MKNKNNESRKSPAVKNKTLDFVPRSNTQISRYRPMMIMICLINAFNPPKCGHPSPTSEPV